jgi:hypothetical protein
MVAALAGVSVWWWAAWSRGRSLNDAHTPTETRSAQAKADLAVRESELAAAKRVWRAREEHESALTNMEGVFENLSNRVLQQTVVQFNQSQEQAMKERERHARPHAQALGRSAR